jgi:glucose-1-phosphate adenylyltransferase
MDRNSLTLILAGGRGTRLAPLTRYRAKPLVRFAGLHRIIDFPLANCLNSGLSRVLALTQHHADGLQRHLTGIWQPAFEEAHGGFLEPIVSHGRRGYYGGTADAVRQTLTLIDEIEPDVVLILAGDHAACLDYRPFLAFHREHGWGATIACMRTPVAEAARQLGVLDVDHQRRVRRFHEKPEHPRSIPGDSERCFASLGIYAFSPLVLADALRVAHSQADFGLEVIPSLVESAPVFAYEFAHSATGGAPYWKDVGTLDTYYQAHRDLLSPTPALELDDPGWPLRPQSQGEVPRLQRMAATSGATEDALNLVADDAVVGGAVSGSVIGPGCVIEPGARVIDSILTHAVVVERGAVVERAILDEHVHVAGDAMIGAEPELDSELGLVVSPRRVVAVPAFHLIAADVDREYQPHRSSNRRRSLVSLGVRD